MCLGCVGIKSLADYFRVLKCLKICGEGEVTEENCMIIALVVEGYHRAKAGRKDRRSVYWGRNQKK